MRARVGHRRVRDVDQADADLRAIRRYAARLARDHDMRLGAAGTHPFSLYENQKITARDRYRMLIEMLQYVARRELVFGMHVHIAVPTPEAALQVMEGVLIELPVLLAISANSPFWRGEATGLRVDPGHDLRRVPSQRHLAAVRELPGLRRCCRLHGDDRCHRRLHPPVVGRTAASRASAPWSCA